MKNKLDLFSYINRQTALGKKISKTIIIQDLRELELDIEFAQKAEDAKWEVYYDNLL